MARTVKIDSNQEVPEIEVILTGPRSRQRVSLIFDTGAVCTQIDTGLIEDLGYSVSVTLCQMQRNAPVEPMLV